MSLFEKRNGKYVSVRDMSASDIQLPVNKRDRIYSCSGWVKTFSPNRFSL